MSAEKLIRKIYVTAVIHFSEKQPHAPGVEVTAHRYVARLVGKGKGGDSPPPQPRIEHIPQSVAEDEEAEDGEGDGEAGED